METWFITKMVRVNKYLWFKEIIVWKYLFSPLAISTSRV